MQPEVKYGAMKPGPAFDPTRHHPLLIPTAGDAYPDWTLEYFQKVVSNARGGKAVVLQFHGVPDLAHPWVYTPPENFRQYMAFLKENGFRVLALGDLRPYINFAQPPDDPMLKARYPEPKSGCLDLPTEVAATRADLRYWLENMLRYHRYSWAEAASVCGMSEEEVRKRAEEFGLDPPPPPASAGKLVRVLPYPGGRHPRIGFHRGRDRSDARHQGQHFPALGPRKLRGGGSARGDLFELGPDVSWLTPTFPRFGTTRMWFWKTSTGSAARTGA